MSVTSGDSFAKTGTLELRRTADTTAAADAGWQAKTWPRSSTFGQLMLTSMSATPSTSRSAWASSVYSCTELPAIDTTGRAPRSSSHGRSLARKASIPGPCRPIELSIPLAVSAIRGVGRPARGRRITDFVTTPPSVVTSVKVSSS